MKTILFSSLLFIISVLSFGQGNGWELQNSGTTKHLSTVYFSDALHGWVLSNQLILKTSNGGQTWEDEPLHGLKFTHSVFFINPSIGWIVGDSGKIIKTVDGGISWQKLQTGVLNGLGVVRFLDADTGWVAGMEGLILKTTDGGSTWQPQLSNQNVYLNKLDIIDGQNLWVAGESGIVLRSDNGGQSWMVKHNIPDSDVLGTHFRDTQTGWITIEGSVLKKTVDGGATWAIQSVTPLGWFTEIAFSNPMHGWYFGWRGGYTSDGGMSWNLIYPDYYLADICFSDSLHGWAVGDAGTILHTTTGGVTPIHKTIVSNPSFTLYPNPAEDWVNLKSELSIQSIHVTDAVGRKVQVSPSGLRGSGLDISAWKPGLYWLRIQTAEGTAVQQVVKK